MDIEIKTIQPILNYLSEPYIDMMQSLWEKSHEHHTMKSRYFKEYYKSYTFETFKKNLMNRFDSIAFLLVFGAGEDVTPGPIACCFLGYKVNDSNVSLGNFVVSEAYRKKKVGTRLFNEVEKIVHQLEKILFIETSYGNDTAIEFYKSLGYYPKNVALVKR